MDQAKLGKETQAALREKEDEAKHWKKLYLKATGVDEDGEGGGGGGGNPETGDDGEGAGGALGVDMLVKLDAEVRAPASSPRKVFLLSNVWINRAIGEIGLGGKG